MGRAKGVRGGVKEKNGRDVLWGVGECREVCYESSEG
jgi:hypothetical protein